MSLQGENLKAIADAIRDRKGTSEPIKASDFAVEIASIHNGEYNIEFIDMGNNLVELRITTVSSGAENITQGGSTLTIIKTNAMITQDGTTLAIGG